MIGSMKGRPESCVFRDLTKGEQREKGPKRNKLLVRPAKGQVVGNQLEIFWDPPSMNENGNKMG